MRGGEVAKTTGGEPSEVSKHFGVVTSSRQRRKDLDGSTCHACQGGAFVFWIFSYFFFFMSQQSNMFLGVRTAAAVGRLLQTGVVVRTYATDERR